MNDSNTNIKVICSVEHLPAFNSDSSKETFSLNLSIAAAGTFTGNSAVLKSVLTPWQLEPIVDIQVAVFRNGSALPENFVDYISGKVLPQKFRGRSISSNAPGFTNFQKFINKLEKKLSPENLKVFTPAADTEIDVDYVTKNKEQEWHTLLSQAAVLPAPIPQLLNLSFIFQVDKSLPENWLIFAAPLIEIKKTDGTPIRLPFGKGFAARDKFIVRPYDLTSVIPLAASDTLPSPTVLPTPAEDAVPTPQTIEPPETVPAHIASPITMEAYIGECRAVPETSPSSYLDLRTLWIKGKTDDQDWRAELESKMAGAFDLSLRIIELLRDELKGADTDQKIEELQNALPEYTKMFLASLRDISGIGFRPAPHGASLLHYLQFPDPVPFPEPMYTPLNIDLNDWKKLVSDNLPHLNKLSIFTDIDRVKAQDLITDMDALHAGVLEPDNLLKLVSEQWKKNKNTIRNEKLNQINLRNELALENLGVFWKNFIKSGLDDFAGMKKNFGCFFQAYCYLRFGYGADLAEISGCNFNTLASDYAQAKKMFPECTADKDKVKKLAKYVDKWSKEFWKETKTTSPSVESTPAAHNVTIQVDKVDRGDLKEDRDLLEAISGVGILIKEREDPRWYCLNMGAVKLEEDSEETLFDFPVLIPYPITYVNDLRSPNPTYSNQPLVAKSPLAYMVEEKLNVLNVRKDEEISRLVYFDYWHHKDPNIQGKFKDDVNIRALKFGKQYQIQPFSIGASGALPSSLVRDKANPASSPCDLDIVNATITKQGAPIAYAYQRKVKVGQIRVIADDGNSCLPSLPIPKGVFPRLRDSDLTAAPSTGKKASQNANFENSENSQEKPLLFLVPKSVNTSFSKTFKFKLRLPSVEINTWDRTVMSGFIHKPETNQNYITELRSGVWADYKELINEETGETNACSTPESKNDTGTVKDVTMDDPAVINSIYLELYRLDDDNGNLLATPKPITAVPATPKSPTALNDKFDISSVQSNSVEIQCETDENNEGITPDGAGWKVQVKKGCIYRFRASASLPKQHFIPKAGNPALFADIYNTSNDKEINRLEEVDKLHYKVGTFEMLIEVATDTLDKNIKGVFDNFAAKFVSSAENKGGGDLVRVSLEDGSGEPRDYPYLYSAEVLRQMWRWQGRDTKPHPEISKVIGDAQTDADIKEWEISEYSNREDIDFTILNMKSRVSNLKTTTAPQNVADSTQLIKLERGSGKRTFEYNEYLTGESAQKEDLRALHYRFKIKVFSRYEGVLPQDRIEAGKRQTPDWKGLFVPCRVREGLVPVPKVKFIFPLTQSFNRKNASGTAGLLIVLDEPWHEVGGIAEGLSATVSMTEAGAKIAEILTTNTNAGGNESTNSNYQFEAGYNPIIKNQELKTLKVEFPQDQIIGPVGHSFDTNTDFPYIGSTSFIIPAPKINGLNVPFDWGMCQIKFRRYVQPGKGAGKQIFSDYTDPLWVEYLPEFTKYAGGKEQVDPSTHIIKIEGSSLAIFNRGAQASKLVLNSETTGYNQFDYYLVLTRSVFDISGKKGQLAYVGALKTGSNGLWYALAPLTSLTNLTPQLGNNNYFAQILKVQRHKESNYRIDSADSLWKSLFERTVIRDKDRARIVSISDPISDSDKIEEC